MPTQQIKKRWAAIIQRSRIGTLPLIGTDPTQQGKGHGSALLRHALALCDEQKAPAYLEATRRRSVPLYQRHGFEILGTIQVNNTAPAITPMLRKPH